MREIKKIVRAYVGNFSELSAEDRLLLMKAAAVRERAQAPYSKFKVGVAIRSEKGIVFAGCNVERCSWSETTHAEQNAIDSMVAACGPTKLTIVALVGGIGTKTYTFPPPKTGESLTKIENVPVPCGHCLQIIWENCHNDPEVRLIALASNGDVVCTTIGDAFPMRFGPADLGIHYKVS